VSILARQNDGARAQSEKSGYGGKSGKGSEPAPEPEKPHEDGWSASAAESELKFAESETSSSDVVRRIVAPVAAVSAAGVVFLL